MGMPTAQIGQSINQQEPQGKSGFNDYQKPTPLPASPQQAQGKSGAGFQNAQVPPPPSTSQPSYGKGGTTNLATSGQPQIGQPNTYSNTVGPWDNSNTQPQVQSGKGKGH